jgi:hypothetical protein
MPFSFAIAVFETPTIRVTHETIQLPNSRTMSRQQTVLCFPPAELPRAMVAECCTSGNPTRGNASGSGRPFSFGPTPFRTCQWGNLKEVSRFLPRTSIDIVNSGTESVFSVTQFFQKDLFSLKAESYATSDWSMMPAAAEWIIEGYSLDPTSGCFQKSEGRARRARSDGRACHAR